VIAEVPPIGPALAIAAIPWALALLFVWLAVRASRTRRYLADTPTSPAAGVFIGDVEVKGTAESDGPICSYLSESACVYHTWAITEDWGRWVTETYRDEKGNTKTRQRWETGSTTVASGGEQIPFYVKDESGVVLIRPDGATIEARANVLISCDPSHPAYYGKGPDLVIADSLQRRTFTEEIIHLHAPVFVAGRARERHDMRLSRYRLMELTRMFLISVRDEKQIGGGYAFASWAWGIAGLVVAAAGALIIAMALGRNDEPSIPVLVAGIGVYPLLLAFAWGWMAFNSIVTLRQRVRRAWANIEVELKRRADLLPNLAAVVKAAGMHEKDTQQVLAILRAQAAIPPAAARDPSNKVQGVQRVMIAIAEAYPAITAQANFLALQSELSNTEARIAIARTYYNGIATAFNARLLIVPDRFLAMIARLRPFELFNATDLEREVPQVRFKDE